MPVGQPLSNEHGAVVFYTTDFDYSNGCGFGCRVYNFSVWRDGAVTEPREGKPVAWSPDGAELFVLHDVRKQKSGTGAPAPEDFIGWLEILSFPDFQSVRTLPDKLISITPVRGAAILRDHGDVVGSWTDVGQLVAAAPDGSAVALSDREFTDARSFVSVFTDGERSDIEPLPVNGYIAIDCRAPELAPAGSGLLISCTLIQRGADIGYELTAVHPL